MRHLCLGKGNLIRDIKPKALFGLLDAVGFVASGSHLGMSVQALPTGTTSTPHRLQATEEAGTGEEWGFVPTKGTFGFKHSKGWRGQRSTV